MAAPVAAIHTHVKPLFGLGANLGFGEVRRAAQMIPVSVRQVNVVEWRCRFHPAAGAPVCRFRKSIPAESSRACPALNCCSACLPRPVSNRKRCRPLHQHRHYYCSSPLNQLPLADHGLRHRLGAGGADQAETQLVVCQCWQVQYSRAPASTAGR